MNNNLFSIIRKYVPITEAEQAIINEKAEYKTYQKGDLLLRPTDISNRIWFTVSGTLRYFTVSEAGDAKTELFIEAGDFFTDLTSYTEQIPSEGFIEAEARTEIIFFDRLNREALKKEIVGWEEAICKIAQKRLESQLKLSRQLLQLEAKAAYQMMLEKYPSIVKSVPAAHLASFLGITPHSLSRIKRVDS